MTTGKTIALTRWTFVDKIMSLVFNMLSRLVITFLPRSKCLLISWLQSPSAVILEPPKIMSTTVATVSTSICHEWNIYNKIASTVIIIMSTTWYPAPTPFFPPPLNYVLNLIEYNKSGAQKNKVSHCFHCFPIYLPWSDGTGCHDLVSWHGMSFPRFRLKKDSGFVGISLWKATRHVVNHFITLWTKAHGQKRPSLANSQGGPMICQSHVSELGDGSSPPVEMSAALNNRWTTTCEWLWPICAQVKLFTCSWPQELR